MNPAPSTAMPMSARSPQSPQWPGPALTSYAAASLSEAASISDLEPARHLDERRIRRGQWGGVRIVEHALRPLDPPGCGQERGHLVHVLDEALVERRIE